MSSLLISKSFMLVPKIYITNTNSTSALHAIHLDGNHFFLKIAFVIFLSG